MKKLLILLLIAALAGAAYLSRPDHEDFERFISEPDRTVELPGGVRVQFDRPGTVPPYTFRDLAFLTTIEQDGRLRYIGAFGQWFRWNDPHAEVEEAPAPPAAPVASEA
jgi:hypothetical protein